MAAVNFETSMILMSDALGAEFGVPIDDELAEGLCAIGSDRRWGSGPDWGFIERCRAKRLKGEGKFKACMAVAGVLSCGLRDGHRGECWYPT